MQLDNDVDILPPSVAEVTNAARAYSQAQKGAIIIALLGTEYAKPIVEAIADRQLRNFVTAMQTIDLVPRTVLLATIADFISDMKKTDGGLRGGDKQTRKLAESILTSERAKLIFGEGGEIKTDKTQEVWDRLRKETPARIADYLNTQRPELVSIVLSNMGAVKAGEVLAELSDVVSSSAASHMSAGIKYDDDIQIAVSELIRAELLEKAEEDDGSAIAGFMADVMGVIPKERRERLLDLIEKDNPDTAEKIRKGLLTFEDLPKRLPKTAIPLIFRDMDAKDLLAALKAGVEAAPETTEFLYANISQRMAEQYKEQVDDLASLSEKEADSAIIGLMSFISRKEKAGTIIYIDAPDTDD